MTARAKGGMSELGIHVARDDAAGGGVERHALGSRHGLAVNREDPAGFVDRHHLPIDAVGHQRRASRTRCASSGSTSFSMPSRTACSDPGSAMTIVRPCKARRGAREHRGGADVLVAQHPEQLAETDQPLLQQPVHRLERAVARRDAGAAGGDDRINCGIRDERRDLRRHVRRLVLQHRPPVHHVAGAAEQFRDRAPAACLSRASACRSP